MTTSHELRFDGSWEGWRIVARDALRAELPPDAVVWRMHSDEQDSLFGDVATTPLPTASPAVRTVPKAFMALASDVARHRDRARWDVLYRALWRLTHGEPHLLSVYVDDDIHRLELMSKAVRREGHKMRAFVRFRLVGEGSAHERYVAWFEPEHDVVSREAPFFARRFPSMRWSILTPDASAHWDLTSLTHAPGVSKLDAPTGDGLEELWRTYYASIFNPARTKPKMMRAEMPTRYWKHLPEAPLIAPLLRDAAARVRQMVAREQDVSRPAESSRRATSGEHAAVPADVAGAHARSVLARESMSSHGVSAGSSPLRDRDVRIGTASWTDPTMTARGVFYPDEARSAAARLAYYASRFSLVEVDSTYYSLPSERNAGLWAERTPPGFVFDIKAHALMTGHATETARLPADICAQLPARIAGARMVRARDLPAELVDEIWRRFLSALEPLRAVGKLGALLLQMPRDFVPSHESERTLALMRDRTGVEALLAVEFRNVAWVADAARRDRALAVLREHDLSYVMVDAPPGFATSMPPIVAVTSERLGVVRLHGRRTETWETPVAVTSERYRYLYDATELSGWVPNVIDVAHRTQGVHVVMNNCHANYGTSNADEITAMLIEADGLRRQMYRESMQRRLI